MERKNVFSWKTTIIPHILKLFMARKIVLFWTILGLIFVIANYHFLEQKQPENAQKKITIFTLNTLAWTHAKMILWDRGSVTISSPEKSRGTQKNLIKDSSIIIDTTSLEESSLKWELQDYKWTYLTIPSLPAHEVLYRSEDLKSQITWIRDAIVDQDKTNPGYYYDSAGNYIHLIESLYETIHNRLGKYHKAKFITLWGNFNTFTERFWLSGYHTKQYNTLQDLQKDKWLKDAIKNEKINHLFVFFTMSDAEVKNIEKTYHITIYRLPQITEDTSAWWYLRYVEKVADQFVRAFDTYD